MKSCCLGKNPLADRRTRDVSHSDRTQKIYTGFWWGSLKERDGLKDLGIDMMVSQFVLQNEMG